MSLARKHLCLQPDAKNVPDQQLSSEQAAARAGLCLDSAPCGSDESMIGEPESDDRGQEDPQ